MTRDEYMSLIMEISELTGDNDDIMSKLDQLRTAYDMRETETSITENETVYTDSDVMDSDGVRWSEKYDDMRRRYRERFFSSPEEAKESQAEDIEKDDKSTQLTFDDLFEEREGDY